VLGAGQCTTQDSAKGAYIIICTCRVCVQAVGRLLCIVLVIDLSSFRIASARSTNGFNISTQLWASRAGENSSRPFPITCLSPSSRPRVALS
jgi:hypothetical protein